ncbi:MAG: DNA/RNA non-specific endonuclease [Bacteroidales bacterium]
MKKQIFTLLVVLSFYLLSAQNENIFVSHTGFSLSYNEKYVQANWVAYSLTKAKTQKVCDRADKFVPDPKLKAKMATNKDYSHSGYDRGHLAPAADMAWSLQSMQESFYFSNVSPQQASFNRGIWKKLESLVRLWAIEYDTIFIVTGPLLTQGLPTIGAHKIAVPSFFYKVIVNKTKGKGIGFIIPSQAINQNLQNFAVSIDSVETVSGIDFFSTFADEQEKQIEKEVCIGCWKWK